MASTLCIELFCDGDIGTELLIHCEDCISANALRGILKGEAIDLTALPDEYSFRVEFLHAAEYLELTFWEEYYVRGTLPVLCAFLCFFEQCGEIAFRSKSMFNTVRDSSRIVSIASPDAESFDFGPTYKAAQLAPGVYRRGQSNEEIITPSPIMRRVILDQKGFNYHERAHTHELPASQLDVKTMVIGMTKNRESDKFPVRFSFLELGVEELGQFTVLG